MSLTKPMKKFKPKPPDPLCRREKLPWQSCKPLEEDAEAPARVTALLRAASYQQADMDIDFLARDESRGVRLQLDFSKAETLLEESGVEGTIVVFGSTRLVEPLAARLRVARLEKELEGVQTDTDLAARLKVARRVLAKSHYYEIARDFGRLVGDSGSGPEDSRLVVMTGGGPGIMEAANRGSYDSNAQTVGLNITLPHEQFPNPYITPSLCFRFHYFALRKMHFMMRAKALVVFPGGFGTLDETFETLTLIQTRKIAPLPVVLVGEDYWRRAIDFNFLVEEGVIDSEDLDLFWFAEDAGEIWDDIQRWHKENGTPLFE